MKTYKNLIIESSNDIVETDYGAIITDKGEYIRVIKDYEHYKAMTNAGFFDYEHFFDSGGIRLIYEQPNEIARLMGATVGIEFNIGDITREAFDTLIKTVKTLQRKFKTKITYHLDFNRYNAEDFKSNVFKRLNNRYTLLSDLLKNLDTLQKTNRKLSETNTKSYKQFIVEALVNSESKKFHYGDYGAIITPKGEYVRVDFQEHTKAIHNATNSISYSGFSSKGGVRIVYPNSHYTSLVFEFEINKISKKVKDVIINTIKTVFPILKKNDREFNIQLNAPYYIQVKTVTDAINFIEKAYDSREKNEII